ITASKFYDWRERYGKVNEHNGWVPRDFWLEDWEKQAIIDFHFEESAGRLPCEERAPHGAEPGAIARTAARGGAGVSGGIGPVAAARHSVRGRRTEGRQVAAGGQSGFIVGCR